MNINWYNPKMKASSVSIATYGLLFSGGAIDALGTPDYILLGYSKEDKTLYVKPENTKSETALEFKSKVKNDYARINEKNFIQFLITQLDPNFPITNIAQKFTARWDDEKGMLTVKLEKPEVEEVDPLS